MTSLPTELSMLTTNSFQKSQTRLLTMSLKCLITMFANKQMQTYPLFYSVNLTGKRDKIAGDFKMTVNIRHTA